MLHGLFLEQIEKHPNNPGISAIEDLNYDKEATTLVGAEDKLYHKHI